MDENQNGVDYGMDPVNNGFKNGVLTLSIASPGLRQELWYRRESLTARINEAMGRTVVKKIEFYETDGLGKRK